MRGQRPRAGRTRGRVPLAAVAGRVAERLAPGPDLAAWLATAPPAGLGDGDWPRSAGSWRRVASWAQARELAAVAQMTSRAAARDEKSQYQRGRAAVAGHGVRRGAGGAGAAMSQYGGVGVDAAGGGALVAAARYRRGAGGRVIDLARARLIAEAGQPAQR